MRACEVTAVDSDPGGVERVDRERPTPDDDFEDAREAYRYVDSGDHQGKVVAVD